MSPEDSYRLEASLESVILTVKCNIFVACYKSYIFSCNFFFKSISIIRMLI